MCPFWLLRQCMCGSAMLIHFTFLDRDPKASWGVWTLNPYSYPRLTVLSTDWHWKSSQPQLSMIGSSLYALIIFGKTRRTSSRKRENVQVGCWAKGMWRQRPHHSSHSHDSFMNSFVPSEVDVFYLRPGLWAGFSFSFPVFILCLCWTDYEKFCGF